MVHVDSQKVQEIGQLLNDSKRPLKERFRALFTLKNLGGAEAIDAISQCFDDESALLKHELAYCLGQMQDPNAIPHLVKVLENRSQEPMVRHEAGKCHQLQHCPVVCERWRTTTTDPFCFVFDCDIKLFCLFLKVKHWAQLATQT